MKKVTRIEPAAPVMKPRKRVAAYARVSVESERLAHSLSAQVSYYNDRIQKNPDWLFAGVYADNGISGTGTEKRDAFNCLIADCEAGRIDLVLTKSISRFARNTVDLLETVRHLKEIGVEVWFERENIRSMEGDGELMLSILASFAQEESRSISDNVKWSKRKMYELGLPGSRFNVYGYRWEGDDLIPVPEEAEIVRRIFRNFIDGKSRLETEREFAAEGITTRGGYRWVDSNIAGVLQNPVYSGDLLLQKEYVADPICGRRKKNRGELPQYLVTGHHEAVICRETFDFVQAEMARRRELGFLANKSLNLSCFSGKVKCGKCGSSLVRSVRKNKAQHSELGETVCYWICKTRKRAGGRCETKCIPERCLMQACADAMGQPEFDETAFTEKVETVTVPDNGVLVFHFKDGMQKRQEWVNTSKKDCWTEEARVRASAIRRSRRPEGKKGVCFFTSVIKCGSCGCNYQAKSWSGVRHWMCRTNGDGIVLREDDLKAVTAEVLGLDAFDPTAADGLLDSILVDGQVLTFCFRDGRKVQRTWKGGRGKCLEE